MDLIAEKCIGPNQIIFLAQTMPDEAMVFLLDNIRQLVVYARGLNEWMYVACLAD